MFEEDAEVYLAINDLTPESAWHSSHRLDHQWLGSIASLEPEQFLLSDQTRNRAQASEETILQRDVHGWRAGRYIGEIHHQGRTLRIRPRLGIDTIAGWLSTIHNVHVLPEVAGSSQSSQSMVVQLAAALWRATVLDAGKHSLSREKRPQKTVGLRIHGSLDVPATSRLRSRGQQELASASASRTMDTPTNAAIVAADRVLDTRMGNPRWRGPRVEEQMALLRKAVGSKPPLPSLSRLRRARYSPIEIRWKQAAKLSHQIASNRFLRHDAKDSATYGLLIDVAELWERFMLHCAAKATSQPVMHGTESTLDRHLLDSVSDESRHLGRLYPDILINPAVDKRTCASVIDAKYKPLVDPRGVDREDLYQIYAYAVTFQSKQALLAYPALNSSRGSSAEHGSPWTSPAVPQMGFKQLPVREEDCIAELRRWLSVE